MEDFRPPVLPVVADLGVIVIDRLHARPKKKNTIPSDGKDRFVVCDGTILIQYLELSYRNWPRNWPFYKFSYRNNTEKNEKKDIFVGQGDWVKEWNSSTDAK